MLKEYAPNAAHLSTTNGPWANGEGMLIAREIGAKLVDMEHVQVHPTGFIKPHDPNEHEKILAAECLRAAGALLINEKGHRFVNELGHRDDVSAAEKGQNGQIRLILNPFNIFQTIYTFVSIIFFCAFFLYGVCISVCVCMSVCVCAFVREGCLTLYVCMCVCMYVCMDVWHFVCFCEMLSESLKVPFFFGKCCHNFIENIVCVCVVVCVSLCVKSLKKTQPKI